MPKTQRQKKIKIGAKFGGLEVFRIVTIGGNEWILCKCKCGQVVGSSESELRRKHKTSCSACADRKHLRKFNPGDVVIYRNAIGKLHFGEQAIVNKTISTEKLSAVEIEYRGRLYHCCPSELEKLRINFYEGRRVKKIR